MLDCMPRLQYKLHFLFFCCITLTLVSLYHSLGRRQRARTASANGSGGGAYPRILHGAQRLAQPPRPPNPPDTKGPPFSWKVNAAPDVAQTPGHAGQAVRLNSAAMGRPAPPVSPPPAAVELHPLEGAAGEVATATGHRPHVPTVPLEPQVAPVPAEPPGQAGIEAHDPSEGEYHLDRPLTQIRRDIANCAHLRADTDSLRHLRTANFTFSKRWPGINVKMWAQLSNGMKTMYRFARCRTYTDWCTNFVSEVIGYHVARVLARDKVPPIVLRRVPFEWLCAQQSPKECAEFAHHAPHGADGLVLGSLQEMWPGVTMKADTAAWKGVGRRPVWPPSPRRPWCDATRSAQPPPSEEDAWNWGQWSDLLLFDYLTDNNDRFMKGTNLFWRGAGGWDMPWIGNGAGFARGAQSNPKKALCGVCKFRRQTVQALRTLQDLGGLVRLSVERCEGPNVTLFKGQSAAGMDQVYADLTMRQNWFLRSHLEADCAATFGETAVISLP
uniref:Uncharacterized protein n=1 Tax=Eutreptiella gymnastica TaxID=73025 RepID=A0A7S1J314_9EUGL